MELTQFLWHPFLWVSPKAGSKTQIWVQGVYLGDDPRKLAHESQDRAGRLTACSMEKLGVFYVNYNLGSNGGARKEHFPTVSPCSGVETCAWEPVRVFHAQPSSRTSHRSPTAWSGSRRCWEGSTAAAERLHGAKSYGWAKSSFCSTVSSLNEC